MELFVQTKFRFNDYLTFVDISKVNIFNVFANKYRVILGKSKYNQ
jgi:hypothetical protein